MTKPRTMNKLTRYQRNNFPFVIEEDEILETLNLTASKVDDMIISGSWDTAYTDEDITETERKLVNTHQVVTQVAHTPGNGLALGIVGTQGRLIAFITYDPGDWRRITCARFYKEEDGSLWMRAGDNFAPIWVESICY